jgi:hypothetical protein
MKMKMKMDSNDVQVTRASWALTEWTNQQLRKGRTYAEVDASFGLKSGALKRWCEGANIPSGSARVLIEKVANIPVSWWSEVPEQQQAPTAKDPEPKPVDRLESVLLEILSAVRESNDVLRQILAPPMPKAASSGPQATNGHAVNAGGHKTGTS